MPKNFLDWLAALGMFIILGTIFAAATWVGLGPPDLTDELIRAYESPASSSSDR